MSAARRACARAIVCASVLTVGPAFGDARVRTALDDLDAWAAPSPGVRNGHAMTYDVAGGRALMFGGADAVRVLGDTWEWDGRRWRRTAAGGPTPRTFPALVYDHARAEAILFGGNRVLFGNESEYDTVLGDTWLWKDRAWRRADVPGPPARAEAAATYDTHRRRVVIFGGYRRTAAGNVRLGDTWEWDGTQWMAVASTGPAPRNGAAMAYDATRRRVVLFGGSGRASDTWEWDGVRWTPRDAGNVPGRFNAVMAYEAAAGRLLRFGGWTGTARADDTWTLADGTWQRLDAQGPSARNHSAMAYDTRRRVVVLFGGHDGDTVFGDTWQWDGATWRAIIMVPPQRRVQNGH